MYRRVTFLASSPVSSFPSALFRNCTRSQYHGHIKIYRRCLIHGLAKGSTRRRIECHCPGVGRRLAELACGSTASRSAERWDEHRRVHLAQLFCKRFSRVSGRSSHRRHRLAIIGAYLAPARIVGEFKCRERASKRVEQAIGFSKCSSQPAARLPPIPSVSTLAVHASIGMGGCVLVFASHWRMARVASSPPIPGIRRSIRTRSGWPAITLSTAILPFSA
jgi:hypothetical protein